MNNGVRVTDGVLTQKSSDEEYERDGFVRQNPGYGYGVVEKTSANSSASTRTSSGIASFMDSSASIGSSNHPAIDVASSGRKIDLIRQRDFPRLLRPIAVSPTTPSGTPSGHQQHHDHQWKKPGSMDASKQDGALVYLDHAGATLFGASQLTEAMESLLESVQGNPHSQGPVSSTTATRLEFARHSVLRHFGASSQDWSVVFTSGATAALKTVGEQFPWRPGGAFVHARSNHTSVLGIREYALKGGADVECLDLEDCAWLVAEEKSAAVASPRSCCNGCRSLDGAEHKPAAPTSENGDVGDDAPDAGSPAGVTSTVVSNSNANGNANGITNPSNCRIGKEDSGNEEDDRRTVDCLFAFPAECNATGARLDLGIASRVKRGALSSERRPPVPGSRCRRAGEERFSEEYPEGWRDAEVEESEDQRRICGAHRRDRTKNSPKEGQDGSSAPWPAAAEQMPTNTRGRERWWVLLDAAKFVGTAPLDLAKVEADFVSVSFYKIFGYPTGLGALLIRESAARILRKRYFGGGTVLAALPDSPFRRFRPETERRLTDGTEHFLGVLALEAGFRTLRSLGGMGAIAAHTSCLARYLHGRLSSIRHANGDPVVRIFGRWGSERSTLLERKGSSATFGTRPGDGASEVGPAGGAGQGPVLAMCFLRPGGDFVGHIEVEKMAEIENIQLRAGSFCNPGACQRALGLKDRDVKDHIERGHVCWDDHDLIDGKPTGLVRVSLGWMSTWEDANAFARFVSRHFVVRRPLETDAQCGEAQSDPDGEGLVPPNQAVLEAIYIYPIKSCAPQRAGASLPHRRLVKSPSSMPPEVGENGEDSRLGTKERAFWPLGPSGLAYDREWALVDHRNRALRLKQAPVMCKIRPFVDLQSRTLTVSAPGMPDLVLPLGWESSEAPQRSGKKDKGGAPRPLGGGQNGDYGRGSSALQETRGVDVPLIVRVCGNRRAGVICAASSSAWFSRFLGVPCSLVRAAAVDVSASVSPSPTVNNTSVENSGGSRPLNGASGTFGKGPAHGSPRAETESPNRAVAAAAEEERAFANEAQYLLISRASVDRVNDVIRESSLMADGRPTGNGSGHLERGRVLQEKVTTGHFRPNLVVNGVRAHEEDSWGSVTLGGTLRFRVTGPCSRCSMINIDPETGDTSGVALKVLATYRRQRAKIVFGQFLAGVETVVPPRPGDGVRAPGPVFGGDGGSGNVNVNVNGSPEWKAWVWEGMQICGAP